MIVGFTIYLSISCTLSLQIALTLRAEHASVYDDQILSSLQWNDDQIQLCYVYNKMIELWTITNRV
jgi:hypothetical protein